VHLLASLGSLILYCFCCYRIIARILLMESILEMVSQLAEAYTDRNETHFSNFCLDSELVCIPNMVIATSLYSAVSA